MVGAVAGGGGSDAGGGSPGVRGTGGSGGDKAPSAGAIAAILGTCVAVVIIGGVIVALVMRRRRRSRPRPSRFSTVAGVTLASRPPQLLSAIEGDAGLARGDNASLSTGASTGMAGNVSAKRSRNGARGDIGGSGTGTGRINFLMPVGSRPSSAAVRSVLTSLGGSETAESLAVTVLPGESAGREDGVAIPGAGNASRGGALALGTANARPGSVSLLRRASTRMAAVLAPSTAMSGSEALRRAGTSPVASVFLHNPLAGGSFTAAVAPSPGLMAALRAATLAGAASGAGSLSASEQAPVQGSREKRRRLTLVLQSFSGAAAAATTSEVDGGASAAAQGHRNRTPRASALSALLHSATTAGRSDSALKRHGRGSIMGSLSGKAVDAEANAALSAEEVAAIAAARRAAAAPFKSTATSALRRPRHKRTFGQVLIASDDDGDADAAAAAAALSVLRGPRHKRTFGQVLIGASDDAEASEAVAALDAALASRATSLSSHQQQPPAADATEITYCDPVEGDGVVGASAVAGPSHYRVFSGSTHD